MPDQFDKAPLVDLDAISFEELGRSPIIGHESDRELFVDLPTGIAPAHIAGGRPSIEREFLAHEFREGY